MSDQLTTVYIDFLPNQPQNNRSREEIAALLNGRFEQRLPAAVERHWKLPPIMLMRPSDEYLELLLEARELLVNGYFYSCVAMCGIVGERLVKDMFRASLLVIKAANTEKPPEGALNQLERVEMRGIIEFLRKAELLKEEAADAAKKLGSLRNDYAHSRGKDPEGDATKAIKMLHSVVEGTVSVLKDFEIKEGKLVPKIIPKNLGP